MNIRVIITGATGLVGEGVLLECLTHAHVKEVLMVNRRPTDIKHPKLKELILPDLMQLDAVTCELSGYDACFYCAGISSAGMNETDYMRITYNIPMHFATMLVVLNPALIFSHISSGYTDSSEKGKVMWARVKGRTENALMRLLLPKVYNFRPIIMQPTAGQKNIKDYYKIISALYPLLHLVFPKQSSTMREVGLAMINSVLKGYPKQILEVADIKALARA